jgi:Spy/CpxP family protein refolding chaperone
MKEYSMRSILVVVLLASTCWVAPAQQTAIYPPIQFNFDELKVYLNLTDAQLQALQTIQQSKNQAQQTIFQQINEKQQQLNALLANSGSAVEIGQLTIDINNLRKQIPLPAEPYRSQAAAILTAVQQAKLAALNTALQLSPAASQAVTLSLIAPLPPKQGIVPLLSPAVTTGTGVAGATTEWRLRNP